MGQKRPEITADLPGTEHEQMAEIARQEGILVEDLFHEFIQEGLAFARVSRPVAKIIPIRKKS